MAGSVKSSSLRNTVRLEPFSNDRVVEKREQQAVQLLHVLVLDARSVARLRAWNRLQLRLFGIRSEIADLHLLEAACDEQVLQRIRVERPDVRDVSDVAREEGVPAGRVHRFEDDFRPWSQFVKRGVEQ